MLSPVSCKVGLPALDVLLASWSPSWLIASLIALACMLGWSRMGAWGAVLTLTHPHPAGMKADCFAASRATTPFSNADHVHLGMQHGPG